MRDVPFFVPFEDEHLAAMVSLPEGSPRAVALLLQGGDATRSHNNQKWTLLARELARRGMAAVRMDWVGMGDSSGRYRLEVSEPPVDQARTVLDLVRSALEVEDWAVVGNCIGLRTGFVLADREPGCVAVAGIFQRSYSILHGGFKAPAAGGSGRRRGLVSGAARRFWREPASASARDVFPEFASVLSSVPVLLLHSSTGESLRRLDAIVGEIKRGLDPAAAERIEMLSVSERSLEKQRETIREVPAWLDRVVPHVAAGERGGAGASAPGSLVR